MSRLKKHIPDYINYPKINERDGNSGLCGALWCDVITRDEKPTCKKCIRKLKKMQKDPTLSCMDIRNPIWIFDFMKLNLESK